MIVFLALSPFAFSALAGWVASRHPRGTPWLAVWPAVVAAVLALELVAVGRDGARLVELPWAPSLGLTLAFNLDGLGLLFALLISAIGALIVLYASTYLEGHPQAGRFHASLFAFMGSMLGVALSDNVLTLFVFWELTGFTSFLLIGFEHERAAARAAASPVSHSPSAPRRPVVPRHAGRARGAPASTRRGRRRARSPRARSSRPRAA